MNCARNARKVVTARAVRPDPTATVRLRRKTTTNPPPATPGRITLLSVPFCFLVGDRRPCSSRQTHLHLAALLDHRLTMELPGQPVTLTAEQIAELNQKLATLRHDVNNHIALILGALEVLQYKPHLIERMMATAKEQPPKIVEAVGRFSTE